MDDRCFLHAGKGADHPKHREQPARTQKPEKLGASGQVPSRREGTLSRQPAADHTEPPALREPDLALQAMVSHWSFSTDRDMARFVWRKGNTGDIENVDWGKKYA